MNWRRYWWRWTWCWGPACRRWTQCSSLQKVDSIFQPREGGPAIEEAGGHDEEAQPVDAVEEGLEDWRVLITFLKMKSILQCWSKMGLKAMLPELRYARTQLHTALYDPYWRAEEAKPLQVREVSETIISDFFLLQLARMRWRIESQVYKWELVREVSELPGPISTSPGCWSCLRAPAWSRPATSRPFAS